MFAIVNHHSYHQLFAPAVTDVAICTAINTSHNTSSSYHQLFAPAVTDVAICTAHIIALSILLLSYPDTTHWSRHPYIIISHSLSPRYQPLVVIRISHQWKHHVCLQQKTIVPIHNEHTTSSVAQSEFICDSQTSFITCWVFANPEGFALFFYFNRIKKNPKKNKRKGSP